MKRSPSAIATVRGFALENAGEDRPTPGTDPPFGEQLPRRVVGCLCQRLASLGGQAGRSVGRHLPGC